MKSFSRLFLLLLIGPGLAAGAADRTEVDVPTTFESAGPLEMTSTETETVITMQDGVVVTGTNLKIFCDRLKVVMVNAGDHAPTLRQIDQVRLLEATGRVRILQNDREATCGRAVVLPAEDKIVLTEEPVVIVGDTIAAGEEILLLRGERRLKVAKPRLTGPPIKDLGFDPDKSESGPANPPGSGKPAAPPSGK